MIERNKGLLTRGRLGKRSLPSDFPSPRGRSISLTGLVLLLCMSVCEVRSADKASADVDVDLVKHQRLIRLLKDVKSTVDDNILENFELFSNRTSLNAEDWDELPSFRVTRHGLRSVDPTLAQLLSLINSGYAVKNGHVSVGFRDLDKVSCVTPKEIDAIFGELTLDYAYYVPMHPVPPKWPNWAVRAYLPIQGRAGLYSFSYLYKDENKPVATCLADFKFEYGTSRPRLY